MFSFSMRTFSADRKMNRSEKKTFIEACRQERLAEFAPPTVYSFSVQRNEAHSTALTSDNICTREPCGKDVDEFLKVMRNLS